MDQQIPNMIKHKVFLYVRVVVRNLKVMQLSLSYSLIIQLLLDISSIIKLVKQDSTWEVSLFDKKSLLILIERAIFSDSRVLRLSKAYKTVEGIASQLGMS